MITEQQFIDFLKENRCKIKFEKLVKKDYGDSLSQFFLDVAKYDPGKMETLIWGLSWNLSPEGHMFWVKIARKLETYLKKIENE